MTRVLIIEDYFDFAYSIRDNFEFKGYEAEYCISSINAVEYALTFRPDWVIIDVRMPYKMGLAVFKELNEKADFEFSVVFYSVYWGEKSIIDEFSKEKNIPDEVKIHKTTDLEQDISERIIPALKNGYLKGGCQITVKK